jgi:hypothetical protein
LEILKKSKGRRFSLLPLQRPADWPAALPLESRCFVMLLALDARPLADAEIVGLARAALSAGLVYLCAWGPDCERVHDLFDDVVRLEMPEETEDSVIMTTWHARESLAEAVGFFRDVAEPAGGFAAACRDGVAVVVGNAAWQEEIRGYFA